MTTDTVATDGRERGQALRRIGGYGAAATMGLYLLVKVVWVVSALLGLGKPDDFGTVDWVVLNVVTIGLSAVGVALGLAMAQPWGRRVPAAPLVLVSWVGTGFLVPLIPYMVASPFFSSGPAGGQGESDSGPVPAWETAFLAIGFIGMALGLVIAMPIYLRGRWPAAFENVRTPGRLGRTTVLGCAGAFALALLDLYWAFGGTGGLERDLDGAARGLLVSWGVAALVAVWGLRRVAAGGNRWPWLVGPLTFAATGSLFAWNAWRGFAAALSPGDYTAAEQPVVGVVSYAVGITAGLLMLLGHLRLIRSGIRHSPLVE